MSAGLTSEMRRGLLRADTQIGVFLGPGVSEVPHVTARALINRGLAVMDGPRLRLTDTGRLAAADVAAAHQRILHGEQ